MSYKEKSQEYRVSIRRKNINERMASFRASQKDEYEEVTNASDIIKNINNIMNNSNILYVYQHIAQIKKYSLNPDVLKELKQYFEILYRMLINIDTFLESKKDKIESIFTDLSTILINFTSYEEINFKKEPTEDIASPLINNIIKNPLRQINSFWLSANILYRHNLFSIHFMKMLIKANFFNYVKERINLSFQSQTDMTIFYYFVGSLVANMGEIQYTQYKKFLALIQQFSQIQIDQLYWYILQGLVQHSSSIYKQKYQIFTTKILSKCQIYCKTKKSRFVIKYLQLISSFLKGQYMAFVQTPQQGKKKILSEQYQRFKRNNLLKNMEFCIENRSPEVKKLLFEIGFKLIGLYAKDISFLDEYFYLTISEQIKNVEKYNQQTVIELIRYFKQLICSLLIEANISKNKLYSEAFIKFVEATQLFQKIDYLVQTFTSSVEILSVSFDIIAFLLQYNIPEVLTSLKKGNLISSLEKIEINSIQLSTKRDQLLDYLNKQQSLI